MKIAITQFYVTTNDAFIDIIDTDHLPEELSSQIIEAIKQGEDCLTLHYKVMRNEITEASCKEFPCMIEGCLTLYSEE